MTRRSESAARELAAGAAEFAAWRRRRSRGTRIPEALWSRAVSLARRHGVSATSVALQVGYYALRDRVAAGDTAPGGPSAAQSFVELPAPLLGGSYECVIELQHAAGPSLRIQWRGSTAPDLAALSREFYEAR